MSPMIILHWLLLIVNVPFLKPHLVSVSYFLTPMNAVLESLFHPPPIHYNQQLIPITQGLLAFVFTLAFFALNFLSEYFKTIEQQLEICQQAGFQKKRLEKLQEAQNHQHKKVLTARRYLVHVSYDFTLCLAGGELLAKALTSHSGNALEQLPDYITLEFPSLAQSLQYCIDCGQALLGYYATLRPLDVQPPFRIGLHVLAADLPVADAAYETRRLVDFAGPNQVVFSQAVLETLVASGSTQDYKYQSLGMYRLEGRQQEFFRLFNSKPRHTF